MNRIVVLGAGESGVGAAILAKKKGYHVWVSDAGLIKNNYKKVLLHNNIEWEEGQHTAEKMFEADEIIKSPGIPNGVDILVKAAAKGIGIISEIEFAARHTKAKLIGITGSNGKTTTASLVYHIFKNAGCDVCLAGNMGKSFAMALSERDYDYFILELSSFQLEHMFHTRLNTTAILNITPDHLDRYNSFEDYADAKFRIMQNLKEEDALVYWDDCKITMEGIKARNPKAEKLPFSIDRIVNNGAYLKNNKMYVEYNSDCFNMFVEDFSLKGRHNAQNSMAASIIAMRNNIRKEKIKESLCDFPNVEHRLEYVCRIRSVDFVNDSKATNVNSTWYALGCFSKPIIWIAGGIDKGNDYTKLKPLVKEKVKAIVCVGLDNANIVSSFSDDAEVIVQVNNMKDAVASAYQMSNPGDIVLLSPACSSFDIFENFEDRGRQFKEAVINL